LDQLFDWSIPVVSTIWKHFRQAWKQSEFGDHFIFVWIKSSLFLCIPPMCLGQMLIVLFSLLVGQYFLPEEDALIYAFSTFPFSTVVLGFFMARFYGNPWNPKVDH